MKLLARAMRGSVAAAWVLGALAAGQLGLWVSDASAGLAPTSAIQGFVLGWDEREVELYSSGYYVSVPRASFAKNHKLKVGQEVSIQVPRNAIRISRKAAPVERHRRRS